MIFLTLATALSTPQYTGTQTFSIKDMPKCEQKLIMNDKNSRYYKTFYTQQEKSRWIFKKSQYGFFSYKYGGTIDWELLNTKATCFNPSYEAKYVEIPDYLGNGITKEKGDYFAVLFKQNENEKYWKIMKETEQVAFYLSNIFAPKSIRSKTTYKEKVIFEKGFEDQSKTEEPTTPQEPQKYELKMQWDPKTKQYIFIKSILFDHLAINKRKELGFLVYNNFGPTQKLESQKYQMEVIFDASKVSGNFIPKLNFAGVQENKTFPMGAVAKTQGTYRYVLDIDFDWQRENLYNVKLNSYLKYYDESGSLISTQEKMFRLKNVDLTTSNGFKLCLDKGIKEFDLELNKL